MKTFLRLMVCCLGLVGFTLLAKADETDTNLVTANGTNATDVTNAMPPARPPDAPMTNMTSETLTTAMAAATNNVSALQNTNAVSDSATNGEPSLEEIMESQLEIAHSERVGKTFGAAALGLENILKSQAPPVIHSKALFELALVMEDSDETLKAQQIWSQYLHTFPTNVEIPEVLLRQGLLYRKMGLDGLAVNKFYAVMSSALKLQEDNMDQYKKLVVQAQSEIADTYFLDAKFEEAADYYNRILHSPEAEPNRVQLEAKLIRSLSFLPNHVETIGRAQSFLSRFTNSADVPEVRFMLAAALKSLGRNQDSMQQVLLLLQSQQANVAKDPATWAYWQKRAGNEIANQLYKEGDFADALQIYLSLADLDKTAGWQIPVWYQIGMIYEQLQQWQKASDLYVRIGERAKELTADDKTPALASLVDMAKWRLDYIAWVQKTRINDVVWRAGDSTNAPAMPMPPGTK